jgi:hypothetical protein
MTVPGVNLICAASLIAAVGNADRLMTSRKLVAYLGLDPKVKQSGEEPARSGRISKRGSRSARWALVEAAWTAVLQPGPLRAFYQRTKARRGHRKAVVATARKLAVLFWCMLTRDQDYAHQQPSLTRNKLRRLKITAGAPKYTRRASSRLVDQRHDARGRAGTRPPGRGLLQTHRPRPASRSTSQESGRERDSGARIDKSPRRATRAAGFRAPDARSLTRHRLAPTHNLIWRTSCQGVGVDAVGGLGHSCSG